RRRHTRFSRDWSSDVCSSDLIDYEAIAQSVGYDERFDDVVFREELATRLVYRVLKLLGASAMVGIAESGHRAVKRVGPQSATTEIGRASCRDRVQLDRGDEYA